MTDSKATRGLLLTAILTLAGLGCSESGLPDACDPACAHGLCDAFSDPARCVCFPGWDGATCEECASGYEDDGSGNCLPRQDPPTCTTRSCSGHGWCDDSSGSVICTCDRGYRGERCELCEAGYFIDNHGDCAENASCGSPDPCAPHGTCDDSTGAIRCTCETGYAGDRCGECAEGYHGDGTECTVDEHCPVPDPCAPGGWCDDSSGVIVCECHPGYAGALCDRCAPGYVDNGSGCVEGAGCEDYRFADNSYVFSMDFGDGQTPCCFDYDEDELPDNAFGDLLQTVAGIAGVEFTEMLSEEIQSGALCLLFDMQGLDSIAEDDELCLSLFWGRDSDGDYENNLDGGEEFTVDEDAFVAGESGCSMEPRSVFDEAWVDQSLLMAEAEEVEGLFFPSPMIADSFERVPLRRARLSAQLSRGTHGIEMRAGRIGGALPVSAFCQTLNDFVAENCACLNLDGPWLECGVEEERYAISCNDTARPDCGLEPPEDHCEMLNSYCGMLTMVLQPDVDTDGDGIEDSMSVGIRFEATSASVTGITP
ncbi:MAG: hypothetical protein JXR96_27110 [Deltaproteobacteria bacterium]|nr:hypothetical protein [Deltaproteobacteria bacterium]